MADAYYNDAPNNFLGNGVHGQTDLDTDDIRIGLRDEGAVALSLAHEDHADVVGGFVTNGESVNLSSKTVGTVGDGIFDHADYVFTTVSGATVESLDYFEWSGASGTSPLLMNLDSWTGLPLTPNGGDVTAAPAAGGVLDIS
jgi:hypothetical protein